jgi:hypothetical protein
MLTGEKSENESGKKASEAEEGPSPQCTEKKSRPARN